MIAGTMSVGTRARDGMIMAERAPAAIAGETMQVTEHEGLSSRAGALGIATPEEIEEIEMATDPQRPPAALLWEAVGEVTAATGLREMSLVAAAAAGKDTEPALRQRYILPVIAPTAEGEHGQRQRHLSEGTSR